MDETDTLLLLMLAYQASMMQQPIHSRYRKQYYKRLNYYQQKLRDRRVPRASLQSPKESAWRILFQSGNDHALITLTGLDRTSFNWLHSLFTPVYNEYSPLVSPDGTIVKLKNTNGKPRLINGRDCLALYLAWTRTRGSCYVLQMLFGMTATCVSVYLRFGRRILIKVLQSQDNSAIRLPTEQQVEEYKTAIKERHPLLENVWCTMDGLKVLLQRARNNKIQNMYYNGWTHDHYVSNVFVFAPDGTIPICCYNVPGSIHDSKIAEWGNIYKKLEKIYNKYGGICTGDSAFARTNNNYILKSSQQPPTEGDNLAYQLSLYEQVTSMRQSAEWGMRALQSSFPRIKDRILYEEHGERKLILKSIILLYNLRARTVGINQIRSVYMPFLSRNANDYLATEMSIYDDPNEVQEEDEE